MFANGDVMAEFRVRSVVSEEPDPLLQAVIATAPASMAASNFLNFILLLRQSGLCTQCQGHTRRTQRFRTEGIEALLQGC